MTNLIPIARFQEIFTRLKLIKEKAKSGKYEIWRDSEDKSRFAVLPLDIASHDYAYLQEQNITFLSNLLYSNANEENREEIKSQLSEYNYKLINRLQVTESNPQESVPFRLADALINKNIESFLHFYNKRTKGDQTLGIKNIQLNHTMSGSFVIPMSIEVFDNNIISTVPTKVNILLREYLEIIDFLSKLEIENKDKFVTSMLDRQIDSTIAKDFFDSKSSVAKYLKDYKDVIQNIYISGKGNPILDYNLRKPDRIFKEVSIRNLQIANDDFIDLLEKKEIEQNADSINEVNTSIEVIVDAVDRDGRVKFSVVSIGDKSLGKSFKAFVDEQPQNRLNEFADAFKTGEILLIKGDVRKAKSQAGKILIQDIHSKKIQKSLFDDEK